MIQFVPISAALLMHASIIRESGGETGIRNRGLLESAMERPKNLQHYEKADLFRMAAAYCYGIIKNHPFVDGNKRTGFITTFAFLRMNGIELTASEEETVIVVIGVADGSVDEKTLAAWLGSNSKKIRNQP